MSYNFNSYVNRQEAESLKEMIFNRVRERSKDISDDIQSDVMDLARNSFETNKTNPFAQFMQPNSTENVDKLEFSPPVENAKSIEEQDNNEQHEEIGFPVKQIREQIFNKNKLINEQMTASVVQNNMMETRAALGNKATFMGALNFLNSQAAISLIKTRADRFEMIV